MKRRLIIRATNIEKQKREVYQYVQERLDSLGYYLDYNVTPLPNHSNIQLVINPHNGLEESIAKLIIREVKEDLTSPAKGYLKFRG